MDVVNSTWDIYWFKQDNAEIKRSKFQLLNEICQDFVDQMLSINSSFELLGCICLLFTNFQRLYCCVKVRLYMQ